ncbi:CdiA family toxin C-terminal domain-containing protein [Photorhabdus luminescens]|uniref:CdiA family toxin C-terminal domain-containing protein n=1 Tax=Photorhabdus luminescens TaxID=29488 RepID=UPI0023D957EE|nr:CdiA family toxin C-terminal domain-containing protein [Photorhabdus luminescens]
MESGIKTADAISGLKWMFNLSAEDAHRISQFVTTENQNDLGLLYNSLPAWEKGALIAKEAVESAGIGGAIGGKASVASIVGKNKQPYQPNQGAVGKGTTTYPEGIHFNINQKNHLTNFDGITQKAGIKGTHNAEAFNNTVNTNGIKIISSTPTSVNGITEIKYQIPAYDRAGNVIGYKEKPFTKTVYDPKIISDQKMIELGQQAASSGYKEAIAKGLSAYDGKAGGITFRIYIDKDTGSINNFHPQ